MMLISDNHGRWQQVYKIIKAVRPTVDYIFHLGDSEFEQDDPIWEMVDGAVQGNMDHSTLYPMEQLVDTSEGKVYLVHGHNHGVNRSNDTVLKNAQKNDAKFAFYGHTHQLYNEYQDGILLVNPGSLSNPRGIHPFRTYAIVTVTPENLVVEYYDENMELIEDLTRTYLRV